MAPIRLAVEDASQVAPARRAAEKIAAALGFDETRRGQTAIVATELATNLLRHGEGGEIVVRGSADGGLEVLAWDRGPGIANFANSERDGISSAGGPGNGLGAVRRLAAGFDVYTAPEQGTVVLARMRSGNGRAPQVDGLALAMHGEEASGDAWGQVTDGPWVTVLLADGLGHGPDAARAAVAAVGELRPGLSPEALLHRMHAALRPTRGAAAAIARYDTTTGALRFAGVGNIAGSIVTQGSAKSLASMNGTLGHRLTHIRGFDYQLDPGALLVLHSDGCRTSWDLARHPGLARRDPLVIASLLIRDHERGRDDVSVVVARRDEAA